MGLETNSTGKIPQSVLEAANRIVRDIPTAQLAEFVGVVNDSRRCSVVDEARWEPFDARVANAGLNRGDAQHLWALEIRAGIELPLREKAERERSKEKMAAEGFQVSWGGGSLAAPSGKVVFQAKCPTCGKLCTQDGYDKGDLRERLQKKVPILLYCIQCDGQWSADAAAIERIRRLI